VLPDGVHNLRGYVKPPTADMLAALSPGGKHHGITTGRRCAVELLSWHVVNSSYIQAQRSIGIALQNCNTAMMQPEASISVTR
jgi:hypothetical protein